MRLRVQKIDTPEAQVKEEERQASLNLRAETERDMNSLYQDVKVQKIDTPEAQVKGV